MILPHPSATLTYIGSQPGKMLSALIASGSKNPVILLDEIDKLGGGASSSISTDNFVGNEIPIDLTRVLFVATANDCERIPPALANRFDVVRLAGFVGREQIRIAREYLIPECEKICGISNDTIVIEDCALRRIVESYCREMGVRELQTNLWRIFRRAVVRCCEGTEELPMRVTEESLVDWLGLPTYPGNRWTRGISPSSASVVGLGWTEAGGTMLEVECLPSSEWLITGQVGVTLQETVRIAASWSKITNPMHVNIGPDVPARKDGPSLGLALAALFWAQRRERTVPHGIGFTGAITLSGGVEGVGGIREKVVAASLGGLKVAVLPKANEAEWKAIEDGLKDGLEVVFVEDLTELEGLLDELAELRRESFMYEV